MHNPNRTSFKEDKQTNRRKFKIIVPIKQHSVQK
jgi:hypothetical protein